MPATGARREIRASDFEHANCLEHGVVVRRLGRDDLKDVPVFDDFAGFVEAKDVYAGVVVVARPLLIAVQDDEVAFCDDTLEVHLFPGVVGGHALEVGNECFLASPTSGLCWMYSSPAYFSIASRGRH